MQPRLASNFQSCLKLLLTGGENGGFQSQSEVTTIIYWVWICFVFSFPDLKNLHMVPRDKPSKSQTSPNMIFSDSLSVFGKQF